MEIWYKRSMSENYMVISGTELQIEENYQIRMLLENQVPGLLPCKVQKINGEEFFYYEITGCQSLQNLFEKRKFGYKELEELFLGVFRIMEKLDEYLLNRDFLLLQPSCIFQDKGEHRYCFVWIPCIHGNIEMEFRQLTEYLLPKIDHTDKQAVTLGYGVYKESMESNLKMDFLKEHMNTKTEEYEVEEKNYDVEDQQERQKILDDFYREEEEETEGILGKLWPVFIIVMGAVIFLLVRNWWRYGSVYLLIGILGIAGILGGIGCWCFFWKKKQEEKKPSSVLRMCEENEEVLMQETEQETGTTVLLQKTRMPRAYLEELEWEIPKKFALEKEITIKGKWRENVDICLEIPTVSRMHGKIIHREGKDFLIDLNSRNGTMLNEVWINPEEEYELKNGDILVFAQKKFRYVCIKELRETGYGLQ